MMVQVLSNHKGNPLEFEYVYRGMGVSAYLFDADGQDREVEMNRAIIANLSDRQLLWIDIQGSVNEIGSFSELLNQPAMSKWLENAENPHFSAHGDLFLVSLTGLNKDDDKFKPVELSILIGENFVLTYHPQAIEFLKFFNKQIRGDTQIGQLNAASLLTALLDWHISSYYREFDRIEEQLERFDEIALSAETGREFVNDLIRLRRRIARLRQLLTSHRTVFAALVRPDFELIAAPEQGEHFRALNERLERAIESIENAREMVIGSFELYMTKTAQNTNEIVKRLSLVIAIVGLIGGIAAIMGMNFQLEIFKSGATGFFSVLGLMAFLVSAVLLFAKRRRWY